MSSNLTPTSSPRTAYSADPYISVIEQDYETADGKHLVMRWMEQNSNNPGVIVIATDWQRVLFEYHHRIATDRTHLELPRGDGSKQDDDTSRSERAVRDAVRELHEETGIECDVKADASFGVGTCKRIGHVYTDPGIMSTQVDVVMCVVSEQDINDVLKKQQDSVVDDTEDISGFVVIDIDDIPNAIMQGQVDDALTVSALGMFMCFANDDTRHW